MLVSAFAAPGETRGRGLILSAYAEAIKPYGLRWFEEPAHPVDYAGNAQFIADYGGAVATGVASVASTT